MSKILKKPPAPSTENKDLIMDEIVPEHSLAIDELTNQIIIKIDDGKFMDTVFEYLNDWNIDEHGVLNYNSMARRLVINGIERDPIQVTLEQKEEFRDTVATPILKHIILLMKQQETEQLNKEDNEQRA